MSSWLLAEFLFGRLLCLVAINQACLRDGLSENREVIGGTEYDEIDSINRTQSLLFTSAVPRRAGG